MKASRVFGSVIALTACAVAAACTAGNASNERESAGGSGPSAGGSSPGVGGSAGSSTSGGAGGQSAGGSVNPVGGGAGTNPGSGGTVGSGGDTGAGGSVGSGGDAGTTGAGGSGGGGSTTTGPCDIYAAAGNACVAAYSVVRRLLSTYGGPLYQVRRGGPDPNTGSGGETQDIGILANGFADAAAHAAFCGNQNCTFSVLYDQSGRGNDLTVAKRGCYGCSDPQQSCNSCSDTACQNDYETDATHTITVGGNTVYTLHMAVQEGYRHNGTGWPTDAPAASGMPTGNSSQGIYEVAEGKARRGDIAGGCCWNFGNVSNNNCYGPSGQMNALMFGSGYWGKGAGATPGPWFMGDFEAGVWAGGTNGNINSGGFDVNQNLPAMTMDFAFGILKAQPNNYAIRVGDANTGNLITAYDGPAPDVFAGNGDWQLEGGIALGVGGDNSNHGSGTFLEGAITASRPSDQTDNAVYENVKALGYGQ